MNTKAWIGIGLLVLVLAGIPLVAWLTANRDDAAQTKDGAEASQAEPKAGEERSFAGITFCWCPAGSFTMGSPKNEAGRRKYEGPVHTMDGDFVSCLDEDPQHEVTFKQGFWISKYEVTRKQWKAVMGSVPQSFPNASDNAPVDLVSWKTCQEFVRKLSAAGHGTFRLPSEAEWEYACRAGTQTPFSFGETLSTKQANIARSFDRTVEVGRYPANAWNLCDMHGNAVEWCQDSAHANYQGAPTDGSAWESSDTEKPLLTGGCRIVRGGWACDPAVECRSAWRGGFSPDFSFLLIGLRLVRTPGEK